jgi:GWxTD domain-containing protein
MRKFALFLIFLAPAAFGQSLNEINYSYLYNPSQSCQLVMQPVRVADHWTVLYRLVPRDTTVTLSDFTIQWELRNSLADKEGTPVVAAKQTGPSGEVTVPVVQTVQLLVARVTNQLAKEATLYYEVLDPKYPVNVYLTSQSAPVVQPYVYGQLPYALEGGQSNIVSYYRDNFPAAIPAFSESAGRVAPLLKVDSVFNVSSKQDIQFTAEGLYLVQQDTSLAQGLAFRVQNDYPRYTKLSSLAGPFIYVCTKQEFERLKAANSDKKAFDKVILSITGDTERAKKFMRSYFRRVELANQYFSSYKEGWKTDRGMIYIVFGLPDNVYKFSDREVWTYKNSSYKVSFNFARSPTLFDPRNYVLIRERKFEQTWYEVIDLWRNARF